MFKSNLIAFKLPWKSLQVTTVEQRKSSSQWRGHTLLLIQAPHWNKQTKIDIYTFKSNLIAFKLPWKLSQVTTVADCPILMQVPHWNKQTNKCWHLYVQIKPYSCQITLKIVASYNSRTKKELFSTTWTHLDEDRFSICMRAKIFWGIYATIIWGTTLYLWHF